VNGWGIKVKRLIICYESPNMCNDEKRLFYKVFSNKTLDFFSLQKCDINGFKLVRNLILKNLFK